MFATKASSRRSSARSPKRRWLNRALLTLCVIVAVPTASASWLYWSTRDAVFSHMQDLPGAPVAIVFGAGLRKGKPSLVLRGRLDASIDLYRRGKVKKLLMSGDNRVQNYNEPEAMRRYAVAHNVPDGDIILDYGGRDTYDTCFRARNVFGVRSAILVTQGYHAARAVYLARGMGMQVAAYAAPNLDQFPLLQLDYSIRESLADVKALWDMTVTHRQPYVKTP